MTDLKALGFRRPAFAVHPVDPEGNTWKHMGIGRLVARLNTASEVHNQHRALQDAAGKVYVDWRAWRKNAEIILTKLPNLDIALMEFRRHTELLIELARERGVRVILVTQTALWHKDITPEEERLLWLGSVEPRGKEPPKTYYSVGALRQGLTIFNDTLQQIAQEQRVGLVDLDKEVSRKSIYFYDGVHFNELGAAKTAETIFAWFKTMIPAR